MNKKLITPKNILISYKGGGYDGCHWETNFFMFDNVGRFFNILSSGCMGVKSREEAIDKLNEPSNSYDFCDVYKLNSAKDRFLFSKTEAEGLVFAIASMVNSIFNKDILFYVCTVCEERKYPREENTLLFVTYKGNGGIGIVPEQLLCEDCYCSHSCSYCGELDLEGEFNQNGHCLDCLNDPLAQRCVG